MADLFYPAESDCVNISVETFVSPFKFGERVVVGCVIVSLVEQGGVTVGNMDYIVFGLICSRDEAYRLITSNVPHIFTSAKDYMVEFAHELGSY